MADLGGTPKGTYVMLAIPNEATANEGSIELAPQVIKQKRQDWIQEGGHMIVAGVGKDCVDTEVDDKVLLAGRAALQEVKLDDFEESFWLVRETDIIFKFG